MASEPSVLRPRDAVDLAEAIAGHPRALEPIGGGSKRSVGRPVDADVLDLAGLAGIVDYAGAELVLTARAATPLAEIERLLDAEGQRLAFEPPDFAVLLGSSQRPTLGGVIAANLSGSRRLAAGAARDHFLGFEAVSGRGELFRAGGRVVKNVTGYDLPKLLAGSWGTLAVMSEITVRVAPRPITERTLIVPDSSPEQAVATMTAALGAALDVSAAAFDPWRGTALRLEGFPASVAARETGLAALVGAVPAELLADDESLRFWHGIGAGDAFADWPVVWRVSVPPAQAPAVLASLRPERYLLDWGGGLIWAAYAAVDAARVRGAIRDGHATLLKAPADSRARTCIQQSPTAAIGTFAARLKRAFDPHDRLNPGRMD
jgi:glycolate oxidase FAD binding subunit